MPKEHETARTRVLSDEEIRTLITGFDQTRYGRALRLLFLTALRRDEVLGLKWSWIDLERGVLTIPPSAEKTGRVRDELRRTGLPPQAVALLAEQRSALFAEGIRSEYVFATSTGERPHPDSLKPILYRLRDRRSNGWPPSKDKRAKQRNAVLPEARPAMRWSSGEGSSPRSSRQHLTSDEPERYAMALAKSAKPSARLKRWPDRRGCLSFRR